MAFSFTLQVTDADSDNLGHVNNARYLDFLERSRTHWYQAVGLVAACRAEAPDRPMDTVVVNVNIDFIQECLPNEILEVTAAPLKAGGKSFTVKQTIVKASGDIAATATVVSVVMDLNQRRAVPLPTTVQQLFASSSKD